MFIQWLLDDKNQKDKKIIIWNAIGGMLNAGQSAIVLVFVSHYLGIFAAGTITIAYAIANLFLTMGKYGIRNYQVTDVEETFTFGEYFYGRIIVIVAVIVMLLLYLSYEISIGEYSYEKAMVIFELTVLKLVDAFEDVFVGRYQQQGRLDVGAKIMAVRLMLSTIVICTLIYVGTGVHIAVWGGMISSVVMELYFLRETFHIADAGISKWKRANVWKLLKLCLPLCIGTTLAIYSGNVPKYFIDRYMDEQTQAIFGYIMMPVFVIMLMNQFIYQPMIKELGELWKDAKKKDFNQRIIKQCLITALLTTVVVLGGIFIGLPVLSMMYHVDLSSFRKEFILLLLGGGCYALAYYLTVPVTIINKQQYIALSYIFIVFISEIFGKHFVMAKGILGAAVLYLFINISLTIMFFCVLIAGEKQNEKGENK